MEWLHADLELYSSYGTQHTINRPLNSHLPCMGPLSPSEKWHIVTHQSISTEPRNGEP